MKEWELINWPGKDQYARQFNWSLKGELDLDLALIKSRVFGRYFEILRNLTNPDQVISMVSDYMQEWALKSMEKYGHYGDVFWTGHSPQELEEFFHQSRLSLPEEYKEAWDQISNIE